MSGGGSLPSYNISPFIAKGQPTVYFNKWQTLSGVDIDKTVGVAHSNQMMQSAASDEAQVDQKSATKNWQGQGLAIQTFHDTDIVAKIKPKFANSKFLIMANVQGYWETVGGGGFGVGISRNIGGTRTLIRGIDGNSGNSWMDGLNSAGVPNSSFSARRIALDSPAYSLGAEITYRIAVGWWAASGRTFFAGTQSTGGQMYYANHTNITVLEIEN